ncbi:hypothetical protein FQA39_LY13209 [Lamprigera yunnana]|nr:hypothetical protein FQA39_LY13209 [Lamprigera yunnana]
MPKPKENILYATTLKKLVKDMTMREHRSSKYKWKIANVKKQCKLFRITSVKERRDIPRIVQRDSVAGVEDVIPLRDTMNGLETMNNEEVLSNIFDIVGHPKKTYLEMVSSPPSTDYDMSLSKLKSEKEQEASVTNRHELDLIEKENLHLSKISFGVSAIEKVRCDKDKSYSYLGVARSDVDER